MRAMIINCLRDYDETGKQDTISDMNQMAIQQNESAVSSQECVGNKAKIPPTILQSKARRRLP